MKLRVSAPNPDDRDRVSYWMWCPACEDAVRIVSDPDGWQWDGNLDAPTFSPSILVRAAQWPADVKFHRARHSNVPVGGQTVCHSFLRNGVWEFLDDCTHSMAGQHVPMVDLPDWLAGDANV